MDILGIRAQAVQEHARTEDAIIVAAATVSCEFYGLGNALGEPAAPEIVAPEAVGPETDPQASTTTSNTICGALQPLLLKSE